MTDSAISNVEKRQDRIEDVIERLTQISSDLNKMVAVHEQRIVQNEKTVSTISDVLERRREESENRFRDMQELIKKEDTTVVQQVDKLITEMKAQHIKLAVKIHKIEKILWTYMGGFTVIVFLLMYGPTLLKLFIK